MNWHNYTYKILLTGVISLFLFSSCGTRLHTVHLTEKDNSVLDLGADPNGIKDSSLAFSKALKLNKFKVVVPAGVYRLDETIEVAKHLFLEAGVKVIRKKEAKNERPIFWLSTSYAVLEGENKRVQIKAEGSMPNGLINIGHKNKKTNNKNILYAEVKSLTITGPGNSSDKHSLGIKLFSAQNKGDGSTACFFSNVENLVVEHLSEGILLKGMANANSIHNIVFNRVGSKKNEAAIVLLGSMENKIYDIFHHYSRNATTLRIDAILDSNEISIVPSYNYIFGVVSEQGGREAQCSQILAGNNNTIGINCNANMGHDIFANFSKLKNKMIID